MRDGTLTPEELAQLELPWSAEMVEGFRLMAGGTIEAARLACGLGTTVESKARRAERSESSENFRARPSTSWFISAAACITPSRTTAKASVRSTTWRSRSACSSRSGIERVAIVDLDVHHGNGTAFIFMRGIPPPRRRRFRVDSVADDVFTFSMHQQHNYPMWKPRGSLDIGLPDGADDERVPRRARDGAAGGDGAAIRSASSIWPARIRTRTISSADCA